MQQTPADLNISTGAFEVKKMIPWIIFLVFFGVLNETVFNVSTPKIAAEFGLQPSGVSWVITSFIIFFGVGSVIYGKLSDIYSLRKLVVIGLLIYNTGSIIGFVFQSYYPLVIVGRLVQGAGASAIPALLVIIIARYFPAEERGRVFGLLTSTVAFSIGVGPVIGGYISNTFHWSFLFLLSLSTLISIPFLRRLLPQEATRKGKIDIPGAAVLSIGLAVLILYLTNPRWYELVISLLLLLYFIIHIRRVEQPFIEPTIFSNRLFRVGLITGFITFAAMLGIMFVLPLMLSGIHHLNTSMIGWVLFPGAISSVVFGTIGGNLTDRKGSNYVVYIGLILLFSSVILISIFMAGAVWLISAFLVLTYIGFSFIQTALTNRVTQLLNPQEMGVGMGIYNLVSFISGAIGTALVARLLDHHFLSFSLLLNTAAGRDASMYSNLFLVFALAVLFVGLSYYRAFRKIKKDEMNPAVQIDVA